MWLEQVSHFVWKLRGEVPTHVDPFFVLDVCLEEIKHVHVTEDSLVFSYLRIILPCGIFLSVFYFTKFHLKLAGLVKIEPVA